MTNLLATLRRKEQRGSRARCVLLTDGTPQQVASRLTALVAPHGTVEPDRHSWAPRGFVDPAEAKLGQTAAFLPPEQREMLLNWWLAVRHGRPNIPNWDIVSLATIHGQQGVILVEAKAHSSELSENGKTPGNADNDKGIRAAILQASEGLNKVESGWNLTAASYYQFCNRFAWSWKIATLGVPVVLLYLGFLRAQEMPDPFECHNEWECLVKSHSAKLVPEVVWGQPLDVGGVPLIPLVRSLELPLHGVTADGSTSSP